MRGLKEPLVWPERVCTLMFIPRYGWMKVERLFIRAKTTEFFARNVKTLVPNSV